MQICLRPTKDLKSSRKQWLVSKKSWEKNLEISKLKLSSVDLLFMSWLLLWWKAWKEFLLVQIWRIVLSIKEYKSQMKEKWQ